MATAIQRRRGNTAQHASFTGLAGEITIDTDKNTVVVHDGSTAGGFPLATQAEVTALGGADITAVVAGNGLTGGATSGDATINVVGGAGITVSADNVAVNAAYVKGLFSATDSGGDGSFSYSDGVFTYTGPSATDVRAHLAGGAGLTFTSGTFAVGAGTGITVNADDVAVNATYIKSLFSATDSGGDGSFSYSDGVFTYTGPSAADVRAHFSAGTGVTLSSGQISIGQAVGTTSNVTFNTVTAALVGNVTGTVSSLANHDTADLAEGTNLYFTAARARGNISVTDAGGDGSLSYDNGTGVITYTGPSASEVRAHFSAGTGVTLSSGQISIGQAVGTTSNVTFNDVTVNGTLNSDDITATNITVAGNLTVTGTTTTVNTATVNLADNIITLNSGETGVPSQNAGIEIERGTSTNVLLRWNETDDKWQFTNDGTTYQNMLTDGAARALISVTDGGGDGSLSYNNVTGEISFFGPTANEVRAHFSAGTGVTYSSANGTISIGQAVETSSNVTFFQVTASLVGNVTGTVSSISNHNTGSLAEGSNLYFTAARARGNISVTDTGGDGSLSYDSSTGIITYTGPSQSEANTRIDARLSGTNGVSYSNGVISLASSTGGDGLTYTSGVLAVGAGSGITVNADNVAVNVAYVRSQFSATGDISYNASTGVFSFTNDAGDIEGVTAGSGLTGGGTTGTVTLNIGAGTGITVNADDVAVNATYIKSLFSASDAGGDGSFSYSDGVFTYTGPSQAEANARIDARISGGAGLTYTSGVLAVGSGYGIVVNADSIELSNANVRALFSGSSGVDYNSTTGAITLASGTAGGGLTYTSGVLAVGAGNYITVAADSVAVDATTTATASKVAARDASGDLYANIFSGTASSARYADLAERYEADAILEPGTVVCFGGTKEITACDHENDHAVAGVVSTDPAYMMNSAAGNNDTHPYIALTGRVPVKVVGPVAKGDLLVASGVKGHAMANNNAKAGTIIGKAIGSIDSGEGVVEALINLM